jgi:hypothetical protein
MAFMLSRGCTAAHAHGHARPGGVTCLLAHCTSMRSHHDTVVQATHMRCRRSKQAGAAGAGPARAAQGCCPVRGWRCRHRRAHHRRRAGCRRRLPAAADPAVSAACAAARPCPLHHHHCDQGASVAACAPRSPCRPRRDPTMATAAPHPARLRHHDPTGPCSRGGHHGCYAAAGCAPAVVVVLLLVALRAAQSPQGRCRGCGLLSLRHLSALLQWRREAATTVCQGVSTGQNDGLVASAPA